MTNTELLKKKINESGYMLKHLASCLNLSRASLSMKINNKTNFSAKEMFALSDLVGLTDQEKREIFFGEDVDK